MSDPGFLRIGQGRFIARNIKLTIHINTLY